MISSKENLNNVFHAKDKELFWAQQSPIYIKCFRISFDAEGSRINVFFLDLQKVQFSKFCSNKKILLISAKSFSSESKFWIWDFHKLYYKLRKYVVQVTITFIYTCLYNCGSLFNNFSTKVLNEYVCPPKLIVRY